MCRFCAALGVLLLLGCSTKDPLQSEVPPAGPPSRAAGDGLALLDATFATEIRDREPTRVATSLSLASPEAADLLFWMELSCTAACAERLTAAGQVTVFLDWYREERGLLLKQATTPLPVKAGRWRTWGSKRITPGQWVAVVRGEDAGWICLRGQCFFSIAVNP